MQNLACVFNKHKYYATVPRQTSNGAVRTRGYVRTLGKSFTKGSTRLVESPNGKALSLVRGVTPRASTTAANL